MTVILTIIHLFTQPIAIPIWGAVSALAGYFFKVWTHKKASKLESDKLAHSLAQDTRKQDREDFQVIKDTLYSEVDRLKAVQAETTKQLEESNEETKKCEQRYFELATQYRELLTYCASLARKVRELDAVVQEHVSKETNEQTRTDPETTGSTS